MLCKEYYNIHLNKSNEIILIFQKKDTSSGETLNDVSNVYLDDIASWLWKVNYLLASSTATAQATVIPTIGLLPAPIRPIISTHFELNR